MFDEILPGFPVDFPCQYYFDWLSWIPHFSWLTPPLWSGHGLPHQRQAPCQRQRLGAPTRARRAERPQPAEPARRRRRHSGSGNVGSIRNHLDFKWFRWYIYIYYIYIRIYIYIYTYYYININIIIYIYMWVTDVDLSSIFIYEIGRTVYKSGLNSM